MSAVDLDVAQLPGASPARVIGCLRQLGYDTLKAELITAEDALRTSDNPNDMRLKLRTQPTYIRSSPRDDPERYGSTSRT